jgi:RNA polymerase sigma factor (sigma-70 family)
VSKQTWEVSPDDDRRQDAHASFERFFVRMLPRAEAVAARLLGDAAASEDAAVEPLARTYLRWPEVSVLGYRDAWTLRVTANLALDQLRRRRHEREHRSADDETEPTDATVLRASVIPAIRRLPRRQREVVFLVYFVGLTQAEVADVLGCSLGTVKSHSHRGLLRLRSELGDSFMTETEEDT